MTQEEFHLRYLELVERISAFVVAGKDPRPVQIELNNLFREHQVPTKENEDGTKSRPVSADRGSTTRRRSPRAKGGSSER